MDKRTIEGIESCRPGSDDLRQLDLGEVAENVQRDAEVRACFERTQLWDAKVAAAMQQVEAPAGLAARLLTALASSEPAGSTRLPGVAKALQSHAASDAEVAVQLPSERQNSEAPPARWSRRQWMGTFTTVAAALALSLVLNSVLRTGEDEPLENFAGAWQKALGPDWRDMQQAPGGFKLPPHGLVGTPTGWQWIDSQMQVQGVAYQLKNAQGATATLYVVHLDRPDDPTDPPQHPQSTSVWAVGYWRKGKNVYVLVTRDEATYRRFINPSPAPLA